MVGLIFGCILALIEGSEKMVTETMDFTDFDKVDIGWGFEVNISQGSEYSISITANENVMDRVIVSKSGKWLTIALKSANYNQVQLKADVYVRSDHLSDEQLRAALVEPCHRIEQKVADLAATMDRRPRICIMPEGPQTIPYVRPAT